MRTGESSATLRDAPPRGRVFDLDAYATPWTFVEDVLTGTACVKVAPGIPPERLPATADPGLGPLSPALGYFCEPDGAVIRVGLVTAVAAIVHGDLVDRRIAYVTSHRLVATHIARAFRVLDALAYDEKSLRAWVRSHDIGTLTIKKRGVGVEPEQLRRRLRPRGSAAATLVVTRVAGRATVLVVERLP